MKRAMRSALWRRAHGGGGVEQFLLRLRPAGTQELVDLHDEILRDLDQLRPSFEILGERGPAGVTRELALPASACGVMRKSSMVDLARNDRIQRDLGERLAALAGHGSGCVSASG